MQSAITGSDTLRQLELSFEQLLTWLPSDLAEQAQARSALVRRQTAPHVADLLRLEKCYPVATVLPQG